MIKTPSIRAHRVEKRGAVGVGWAERDYAPPGEIHKIERGEEELHQTDLFTLAFAGGVIMRL